MEQSDKAYFLKNLELALLLSVKGMKELYGLKMGNMQNPGQALVYQALFELEKNHLISFHDKENIEISPEMEQILENIKNTGKILLYYNKAAEYPDQCIYLDNSAVFVSSCGTLSNRYRIKGVPLESVPEEVCECGFHIKEMLDERTLFREEEIENAELAETIRLFFSKSPAALREEEWGCIKDCISVISLKNRQCVRQYLLMKDGLSDYFSVADEEKVHIFNYSKKKVIDILRKEIGGMLL